MSLTPVTVFTEQQPARKQRRLTTLAALLFGLAGLAAFCALSGPGPIQGTQFLQEEDPEIMRAYVNFVAEYGRAYSSKKHAGEKFEVFKRNYEAIKEHNKHEGALPYAMAVNQFADMSPAEFAKLRGLEMPKVLVTETVSRVLEPAMKVHHHKHHNSGKIEVSAGQSLPESVNWYEKGAVSQPQDQGFCGSCWAFTTAATLESLSVISGKFSSPPHFSMQ